MSDPTTRDEPARDGTAVARPARVELAGVPTTLTACDRLGEAVGLAEGQLWVKRDDLTSLAAGGNKARKLEFLVADALEQGATVLVTAGAAQSNHVRMTAAAGAMSGLRVVGVLGGSDRRPAQGNLVLDHLLGLEIVWASATYGPVDLDEALQRTVEVLAAEGERPYLIPLGGSSPVGAYGYAMAAQELLADMPDEDFTVVVADGTGGTHAGLVAGFGRHDRVTGVDVGAVPGLAAVVDGLAVEVADLLGGPPPVGSAQVLDGFSGDGYGRPTEEGLEALRLAARLEGLVLDPVYTGKAMAGLIATARRGGFGDRRVVFVHTGGLPGLLVDRFSEWIGGTD